MLWWFWRKCKDAIIIIRVDIPSPSAKGRKADTNTRPQPPPPVSVDAETSPLPGSYPQDHVQQAEEPYSPPEEPGANTSPESTTLQPDGRRSAETTSSLPQESIPEVLEPGAHLLEIHTYEKAGTNSPPKYTPSRPKGPAVIPSTSRFYVSAKSIKDASMRATGPPPSATRITPRITSSRTLKPGFRITSVATLPPPITRATRATTPNQTINRRVALAKKVQADAKTLEEEEAARLRDKKRRSVFTAIANRAAHKKHIEESVDITTISAEETSSPLHFLQWPNKTDRNAEVSDEPTAQATYMPIVEEKQENEHIADAYMEQGSKLNEVVPPLRTYRKPTVEDATTAEASGQTSAEDKQENEQNSSADTQKEAVADQTGPSSSTVLQGTIAGGVSTRATASTPNAEKGQEQAQVAVASNQQEMEPVKQVSPPSTIPKAKVGDDNFTGNAARIPTAENQPESAQTAAASMQQEAKLKGAAQPPDTVLKPVASDETTTGSLKSFKRSRTKNKMDAVGLHAGNVVKTVKRLEKDERRMASLPYSKQASKKPLHKHGRKAGSTRAYRTATKDSIEEKSHLVAATTGQASSTTPAEASPSPIPPTAVGNEPRSLGVYEPDRETETTSRPSAVEQGLPLAAAAQSTISDDIAMNDAPAPISETHGCDIRHREGAQPADGAAGTDAPVLKDDGIGDVKTQVNPAAEFEDDDDGSSGLSDPPSNLSETGANGHDMAIEQTLDENTGNVAIAGEDVSMGDYAPTSSESADFAGTTAPSTNTALHCTVIDGTTRRDYQMPANETGNGDIDMSQFVCTCTDCGRDMTEDYTDDTAPNYGLILCYLCNSRLLQMEEFNDLYDAVLDSSNASQDPASQTQQGVSEGIRNENTVFQFGQQSGSRFAGLRSGGRTLASGTSFQPFPPPVLNKPLTEPVSPYSGFQNVVHKCTPAGTSPFTFGIQSGSPAATQPFGSHNDGGLQQLQPISVRNSSFNFNYAVPSGSNIQARPNKVAQLAAANSSYEDPNDGMSRLSGVIDGEQKENSNPKKTSEDLKQMHQPNLTVDNEALVTKHNGNGSEQSTTAKAKDNEMNHTFSNQPLPGMALVDADRLVRDWVDCTADYIQRMPSDMDVTSFEAWVKDPVVMKELSYMYWRMNGIVRYTTNNIDADELWDSAALRKALIGKINGQLRPAAEKLDTLRNKFGNVSMPLAQVQSHLEKFFQQTQKTWDEFKREQNDHTSEVNKPALISLSGPPGSEAQCNRVQSNDSSAVQSSGVQDPMCPTEQYWPLQHKNRVEAEDLIRRWSTDSVMFIEDIDDEPNREKLLNSFKSSTETVNSSTGTDKSHTETDKLGHICCRMEQSNHYFMTGSGDPNAQKASRVPEDLEGLLDATFREWDTICVEIDTLNSEFGQFTNAFAVMDVHRGTMLGLRAQQDEE